MSENLCEVIVDFGSSKIRMALYEYTNKNNCYFVSKKSENNFLTSKLNLSNSETTLDTAIKDLENNSGHQIKDISLMLDTPETLTIDLSISQNYDFKEIGTKEVKTLIQDSRLLIQKHYQKQKIIHIIINKYQLDDEVFYSTPKEKSKCKKLIVEIKFICIPLLLYENLKQLFTKNHIEIKEIFSSSYVKSLSYLKYYKNHEVKIFLDIGQRKTSVAEYKEDRLANIYCFPIGGEHITKDISKVLKIDMKEAENLKCSFNQANTTFADQTEKIKNNKDIVSQFSDKEISLELLNRVIFARVEEIIKLVFENLKFDNYLKKNNKCILVLTGEGSKILDKNSIYLNEKFNIFEEINFFEDNIQNICQSCIDFKKVDNSNKVQTIAKKTVKYGFFERVFHFFT